MGEDGYLLRVNLSNTFSALAVSGRLNHNGSEQSIQQKIDRDEKSIQLNQVASVSRDHIESQLWFRPDRFTEMQRKGDRYVRNGSWKQRDFKLTTNVIGKNPIINCEEIGGIWLSNLWEFNLRHFCSSFALFD
ncbi:hypothetical protein LXL04_009027 [Taraxacum kok-saghyz]